MTPARPSAGFKVFHGLEQRYRTRSEPSTVGSVHPKACPSHRQDGAANALGFIFFPFANKYGIYMHDTASRWLFTEGSRTFAAPPPARPLDFVKIIKGKGSFDKQKVQAVAAGQQAHYYLPRAGDALRDLPHRHRHGNDVPTFRSDVYGRDRRVVRAEMAKPGS